VRLFLQSPNDGKPGEIHPIALQQLETWQHIATVWAKYVSGRCVRCDACGQSIYMHSDSQGNKYTYTHQETLALTVAHIRQRHAEVIDYGIE